MGKKPKNGGFSYPDYASFIPYMWLCVCYDRLGDFKRAKLYNDLAGTCKPNDPNYLYNKKYFEQMTNDKGENI